MAANMDVVIVFLYLLGMIAFGFWGKRRATTQSDFLVAGRRLGPALYSGTMAAIVLGGASTIGGVGLGYQYGISGMWLVIAIGVGILALSLLFAGRIQRLRVYTVSQMLELRYGPGSSVLSGVVMWGYTLMLSVTSTIAYSTIFGALFDIGKVPAIILGGSVVIIYSTLGGMWSITLTDFVQFLVKTIGIFFILLPIALYKTDGISGLAEKLPADATSFTAIGGDTILTYFVVYTFGLLIGQDIWQRVFTARSPGVARWAGAASGVYCLLYAVAGAVIGMAAKVLLPALESRDDAFAQFVEMQLPPILAGLVLAAALAAVMSTSSGALIATATVFSQDIVARLRHRDIEAGSEHDHIRNNRLYVAGFGIVMVVIACVLQDVVAALTVAYDILVGGLLVPILGGLIWRRGTNVGAVAAMAVGTIATLATMIYVGDIYANEPIYVGLASGLVVYAVGSPRSPPTPKSSPSGTAAAADKLARRCQRRFVGKALPVRRRARLNRLCPRWCPRWDSNPHCLGFESSSSASWDTRAWFFSSASRPSHHRG
jgi:solute:Na+ symporter, SSS family